MVDTMILRAFFSLFSLIFLLPLCVNSIKAAELTEISSVAAPVKIPTKNRNVQYGTLTENQTWAGDVYLVGDVIVPEGIKLSIDSGTRLFYAEYDITESGNDAQQTEIIVHGEVAVNSTPENPVLVATIGNPDWNQLSDGQESVELSFKPYIIDTEPMKEEFHQFKKQYLILWSLIYAMWVLAL